MSDSLLADRLAALREGDRTVPLEFDELRDRAREQLSSPAFDYAAAGGGTGETLRANRAAFQRYGITTRVLRDVSERRLDVELFGRSAAAPLVLAPVGRQQRYHADGELATARAAAEVGVPLMLSTAASYSIEDVAAANGDGSRLFQLYWPRDWAVAASLVERATAAGYDGIVLTLDSQVPTWRQRHLRNAPDGTEAPKAVLESDPVVEARADEAGQPVDQFVHESPTLRGDASLTWTDLDTLGDWTDLPIVLKGILDPADARQAAEWGADGIVVSNHGGRQIDGAVAALRQLPVVVEAVDGDTPVLFDSGIRGGADVFTALALGADGVLLGRPYLFGLAIAGEQGVTEVVLNCLAELESAMGLSGRASIAEIGPGALVER